MVGKFLVVLKSKVAIAAIGALLVAGAGATAAGAATGGHFGLAPRTHDQVATTNSANETERNDQASGVLASVSPTATEAVDKNEANENEANENEANENEEQAVTGTVQSVDALHATFVVQLAGGTTQTVDVSTSTEFSDGLRGIADLTVGSTVEVEGIRHSDGTFAATQVKVEGSGDGSGDSSNSGGSDGSGSSGGSDGSGSSGSSGGDSTSSGSGDGGH